jgi:WD40 repeat protein
MFTRVWNPLGGVVLAALMGAVTVCSSDPKGARIECEGDNSGRAADMGEFARPVANNNATGLPHAPTDSDGVSAQRLGVGAVPVLNAAAASGSVIVAIRGNKLAEFEESLPPQALVRFGSTRFRHPTEFTGGDAVLGRYLVTVRNAKLVLTDMTTGQLFRTLDMGFREAGYPWFSTQVSPGARWLLVRESIPCTELVARIWKIQADPDNPLGPGVDLRLANGDRAGFGNRIVFSADDEEVYAPGESNLNKFDPRTGQLRARVSTENKKVMAVANRGKRFLTTSDDEPDVMVGFGSFMSYGPPVYRFKQRTSTENREERNFGRHRSADEAKIEPFDLVVRKTTGELVAKITIPREQGSFVTSLDLSPDGKFVSVHGKNGLEVWNVDRPDLALTVKLDLKEHEFYDSTGFSADSRSFLVTTYLYSSESFRRRKEHQKRVFDLETGKEIQPPAVVRLPILDSELGVMCRRDAQTGTRLPLPSGYAGVVTDVSRDGQLIAIGDRTGRLDLWNMDGRCIANLRPSGARIFAVAFSPDDSRLAASDQGRTVQIWSTRDGRELDRFDVPAEHDDLYPEQITFSPDGRRLLINAGEIMSLWDSAGKNWVWHRAEQLWHLNGHARIPIAFSPDGRQLVFSANNHTFPHDDLSTWIDANTGERQREIAHRRPMDRNHSVAVTAMALAPDGATMAVVLGGRDVQLWDADTGKLVREFHSLESLRSDCRVVRFSPDGRRLATANDSGVVFVWETGSGGLAHTLANPDSAINDFHFGSDSRTLITSNHREVMVWTLRPVGLAVSTGATDAMWNQLRAREIAVAESARWQLLDNPAETVRLARAKFAPAPPLHELQIKSWIAQLDETSFNDRETATASLREVGRRVVGYLREPSKNSKPEIQQRLANLLREFAAGPTATERQQIRVVELIELIGTAEAWALIDEWARGATGAVLTEQAAQALARRNKTKSSRRPGFERRSLT